MDSVDSLPEGETHRSEEEGVRYPPAFAVPGTPLSSSDPRLCPLCNGPRLCPVCKIGHHSQDLNRCDHCGICPSYGPGIPIHRIVDARNPERSQKLWRLIDGEDVSSFDPELGDSEDEESEDEDSEIEDVRPPHHPGTGPIRSPHRGYYQQPTKYSKNLEDDK